MMKDSKNDERLSPSPLFLDYKTMVHSALGALHSCLLSCIFHKHPILLVQFSSVAQLCPTLCNPMNRSTPGLPVHHQLPEFTQDSVHRVGDAIQPSHPRSSPSPPAPNPS